MRQPLIGLRLDQALRGRTPILRRQLLAVAGRILHHACGITLRLPARHTALHDALAALRALARPGPANATSHKLTSTARVRSIRRPPRSPDSLNSMISPFPPRTGAARRAKRLSYSARLRLLPVEVARGARRR